LQKTQECCSCHNRRALSKFGKRAKTCYECQRERKKLQPYYFFHSRAKGDALRGMSYLILQEAFNRQHGLCFYCKKKLRKDHTTHFDHKIPRHRGGSQSLQNIVAACKDCNQLKGTRTATEFRRFLKSYTARFA
jgi:5-methylcytosine-specific restriction endonuclease McrA